MRARFPIAQDIAKRFADLDRQHEIGELKIKISGCINACGHHHAGHIGILGVDKKGVEFYQLQLGGSGAEDASIGDIMGPGFGEHEIADAVERVVDVYLKLRAGRRTLPRHLSPRRHGAVQERRLSGTDFMPLIKDGAFAADRFARVADDAALPETAARWSRWRASRRSATRLLARNAPLGVRLQVRARIPKLLGDDVHRLSLVALEFPIFRDGRAFSWARMLRTRLGFNGEIRAVGDFLYDQIAYHAPRRLRRLGGAGRFHPRDVHRGADRNDQRLSAQRRRQENHPRAARCACKSQHQATLGAERAARGVP